MVLGSTNNLILFNVITSVILNETINKALSQETMEHEDVYKMDRHTDNTGSEQITFSAENNSMSVDLLRFVGSTCSFCNVGWRNCLFTRRVNYMKCVLV